MEENCRNPVYLWLFFLGAILFGLGWRLAGLCPGSAIAGLLVANGKSILLVISMFAGFYLHQLREEY